MNKVERARQGIESSTLLTKERMDSVLNALSAKKTWALRDLSHNELLIVQAFAAFGVLCYFEGVGRVQNENGNTSADNTQPDNSQQEHGAGDQGRPSSEGTGDTGAERLQDVGQGTV